MFCVWQGSYKADFLACFGIVVANNGKICGTGRKAFTDKNQTGRKKRKTFIRVLECDILGSKLHIKSIAVIQAECEQYYSLSGDFLPKGTATKEKGFP